MNELPPCVGEQMRDTLVDIHFAAYEAAWEAAHPPPENTDMAKRTARIKNDAANHDVPQNHEDVVHAIAAIGEHQRERDRIQAAMNDELATLRESWEAKANPHAEAIKTLAKGVQLYCESHRDELTKDGKTKTARFASGEVKWRMRPPSVVVRGKDAVIEALHQLKLDRFLRTKLEVNKDAILADPEGVRGVKGISIRQREDFVVEPWDTELEEIA